MTPIQDPTDRLPTMADADLPQRYKEEMARRKAAEARVADLEAELAAVPAQLAAAAARVAEAEAFPDSLIERRLAELTPSEVLDVVHKFLGRTVCRWCGTVPSVEESEGHWLACEKHPARARLSEVERERDAWENGAHYWLREYNRIAKKHGEHVAPEGEAARPPEPAEPRDEPPTREPHESTELQEMFEDAFTAWYDAACSEDYGARSRLMDDATKLQAQALSALLGHAPHSRTAELRGWVAFAEGVVGVEWVFGNDRKLTTTFCDPPEFYAQGPGFDRAGALDSAAPFMWLCTGTWTAASPPDGTAPERARLVEAYRITRGFVEHFHDIGYPSLGDATVAARTALDKSTAALVATRPPDGMPGEPEPIKSTTERHQQEETEHGYRTSSGGDASRPTSGSRRVERQGDVARAADSGSAQQDDGTLRLHEDRAGRPDPVAVQPGGPTGDGLGGGDVASGCDSCGEENPPHECPGSKRPCGHHCNHSWSHDACCWCEKEFGEEESSAAPPTVPGEPLRRADLHAIADRMEEITRPEHGGDINLDDHGKSILNLASALRDIADAAPPTPPRPPVETECICPPHPNTFAAGCPRHDPRAPVDEAAVRADERRRIVDTLNAVWKNGDPKEGSPEEHRAYLDGVSACMHVCGTEAPERVYGGAAPPAPPRAPVEPGNAFDTIADHIECMVFAFDKGDSRRDDVRKLAAWVREHRRAPVDEAAVRADERSCWALAAREEADFHMRIPTEASQRAAAALKGLASAMEADALDTYAKFHNNRRPRTSGPTPEGADR